MVGAENMLSYFKLGLNKVQPKDTYPAWYKILHADISKLWKCYVVFCGIRIEDI